MAGSYILCNKLHNNGLMIDWSLIYWIGFRRESGIEDWERTTQLRPQIYRGRCSPQEGKIKEKVTKYFSASSFCIV